MQVFVSTFPASLSLSLASVYCFIFSESGFLCQQKWTSLRQIRALPHLLHSPPLIFLFPQPFITRYEGTFSLPVLIMDPQIASISLFLPSQLLSPCPPQALHQSLICSSLCLSVCFAFSHFLSHTHLISPDFTIDKKK